MLILTHQQQTAFENIVRKGEIAGNEQFLLFPQCFLLNHVTVSPFFHSFDTTSLFAAELEESKVGKLSKFVRDSLQNHWTLPNRDEIRKTNLIA